MSDAPLLNTELANFTSDPYYWSRALDVLPNPDPILRKIGKAQAVYDAVAADAHVIGERRAIRSALLAYEFRVQAGGETRADKKAADFATELLSSDTGTSNWSDTIWTLANALFCGMAIHEIVWQRDGNIIYPEQILDRPNRRFAFDRDRNLRLLTTDYPTDGELVPERKFLLTRHMSSAENPYGEALYSACFWPYTFKHSGVKWLARFCERYGFPWPIVKYPQGTTDKEQRNIVDAAAAMIEDAVLAVPEGTNVEFGNAGTGTQADVHTKLVELCNREMSKALTSQTLATEITGQGSFAAAQTHAGRAERVNEADREMVARTINTLFRWCCDFNFPNAAAPTFEFYEEGAARAEWVKFLTESSRLVSVPQAWAYERLQIPEPVGDEPVIAPAPAPNPQPNDDNQFAANDQDDLTEIDKQTAQAIADINSLANQATSLEDLRDRFIAYAADQQIAPDTTTDIWQAYLSGGYLSGMDEAGSADFQAASLGAPAFQPAGKPRGKGEPSYD